MIEKNDKYTACFFKIADDYRDEMSKIGYDFIYRIGKFVSIRKSLNTLYGIMLAKGMCEPVQSMGLEEKKEMWQEAINISVDPSLEARKETFIALYALSIYLQT